MSPRPLHRFAHARAARRVPHPLLGFAAAAAASSPGATPAHGIIAGRSRFGLRRTREQAAWEGMTVTRMLCDLTAGRVAFSSGPPCPGQFQQFAL
ncbi:MAG: hypothetical protein HY321_17295 [Armatimonadetes bacterium]|nr:hypothetical protein [Armatimonadota bacterium]